MQFTYDLNTHGCLILKADEKDKAAIREAIEDHEGMSEATEAEVMESLIANSDLEWIDPSETGDLTDAPMLGIRDSDGKVTARWAFMDYQVRSFLQDLLDKGQVVFIS